MATPEQLASHVVRLRASAWGLRLFRNNTGVLMNQEGRPVRFGLGNESAKLNKKLKTSDYIGWTPVTITPEMVGKQVPIFTALEAKPEGTNIHREFNENSREYAQKKFIDLVIKAGGLAGFTRNDDDVDQLIKAFMERLRE